jgi:proteasome lid subunit RPN8/RPN11
VADDDIQFGEMEEQQPEDCLRPDQNKHYAVVAYGQPGKGDLPVYVDLDVLLDMEAHALSDTSVELGGVLLGGQYQDDEGRPFVVISDSLRARHYESTKGSFKFTHDTWEAISRERDQFPAELQMVGWYHTHPDWGVFLSGMDMFICNNFFNKRLDVAYVIDPCRDDRAFFMWNGDSSKGVRRTGGFYVTASRFRGAELAAVVEQAQNDEAPMRTVTPATGGAPQVIVTGPPPKPAWEGLAVIGMLTLQFCLLTILAWRLLAPAGGETKAELTRLSQRLEAFERGGEPAEERRAANEMLGRVAAGSSRALAQAW